MIRSSPGCEPEVWHCCSLDIENFGILIEGASGSGKTMLMFRLVECFLRAGLNSAIVSDDYTVLTCDGNNLTARSAKTIQGQAEVRGFGIAEVDTKATTQPGLIVSIVEDGEIERLPESASFTICSTELPHVRVPLRHEEAAARIVIAWLRQHGIVDMPFPAP